MPGHSLRRLATGLLLTSLLASCYQSSFETGSSGQENYEDLGVSTTWSIKSSITRNVETITVEWIVAAIGPGEPTVTWGENRRLEDVLLVGGEEVSFPRGATLALVKGGRVAFSDRSWKDIAVDPDVVTKAGPSASMKIDRKKWEAVGGFEGLLKSASP
jgi:hypothetical protein